jgi:hypothetical protein
MFLAVKCNGDPKLWRENGQRFQPASTIFLVCFSSNNTEITPLGGGKTSFSTSKVKLGFHSSHPITVNQGYLLVSLVVD